MVCRAQRSPRPPSHAGFPGVTGAALASVAQHPVPDALSLSSKLKDQEKLLVGTAKLLFCATKKGGVGDRLWLLPASAGEKRPLETKKDPRTTAALPKTESESGAGKEWSRGERVSEGVPISDLFVEFSELAPKFYSSWRGMSGSVGKLCTTHDLAVAGLITQEECAYAKELLGRVSDWGVRHTFYAEGKFLCRFSGRSIEATRLRAPEDPDWSEHVGRAADAFRLLGVKGPFDAAALLGKLTKSLSSAYTQVLDPRVLSDAWDKKFPLYTRAAPSRQDAALLQVAPLKSSAANMGQTAALVAGDPTCFSMVNSIVTSALRGLDDPTFRWWVMTNCAAQQITNGQRSGAVTPVP